MCAGVPKMYNIPSDTSDALIQGIILLIFTSAPRISVSTNAGLIL